MAEIRNSALLDSIFAKADELAKENACGGLNRDYLVAAALMILVYGPEDAGEAKADPREFAKAKELLSKLQPAAGGPNPVKVLLDAWHGKDVTMNEKMILTVQRGKAVNTARAEHLDSLPADLFLSVLLSERTQAMKAALAAPQSAPRPQGGIPSASAPAPAPQPETPPEPFELGKLALKVKALQRTLQQSVMGQAHAVSTFAAGYFQSELQAAIEAERTRPRTTYLFAGPPGVGKTFLSEEAAKALGLPFKRFDMSEFTDNSTVYELTGNDPMYKGSSEGQLTGFVKKNPRCVLLFDEIEKACLQVIHLFLQVMDAGRLRDNCTDEEVSFKDAILIFTTNAGKRLYEADGTGNLAGLTRDVILDALAKDVNPLTREPYFPAAICSRFASGNVVMFNHLDAYALRSIAEKRLRRHFADLEAATGFQAEMDATLPTALLLAEGASADARTVKSRADAFFGGELYELFRLVTSDGVPATPEDVKRVRFHVDIEHAGQDVAALFIPKERIHAVVYSDQGLALPEGDDLPLIHQVRDAQALKELTKKETVRLALCDLRSGCRSSLLNREDVDTPARAFLHELLLRYPELPVLVLESEDFTLTDEEKDSYLRRGVRGFINAGEDFAGQLRQAADTIFQQQSLVELARGNQLVSYETAQRLLEDGAAEVTLFDMRLRTAVKADDQENVLSMFSKPDKRFDDVIGAEDAKAELTYFVNYLKDPRKFAAQGVAAPKGVLLYGPPGTGKTMLAKAFAAESGAVFIATEGNRFHKKYIGEGQELVHKLFATARRYAPAVLFIDEIDTIARARSGRDDAGAASTEQVLTALFAEMDGFNTDPSRPVFVLAATNYSPEPGSGMSLDPAMMRRFDRRILVDLPSMENRKLYLTRQIRGKPLFLIGDEEIASLAERSTGMSLAQLESILELAMRAALRQGGSVITDRDLEEAFEEFTGGAKKTWNPETTLRTARHEAGHTLISYLSGEKPSYVTIVSRGNYGGYMQHADQEDKMGYTRQELLARIRTALGGRAAELVYYGPEDGVSTGPSGDLRTATATARQMLCAYGMDEEFGLAAIDPQKDESAQEVRLAVNRILRQQLDEATRLIAAHRPAIDALVDRLMKLGHLKGQDIDKLLSGVL